MQSISPTAGRVYLRDDGHINDLYGGNKVRKLEFILGDAISRGVSEVWTIGGLGSHHALATALHCQRLGLKCHIFHVHQPITPQVKDTLSALASAKPSLHLMSPPQEGEKLAVAIRSQLEVWLKGGKRASGKAPYFIPAGGSSCRGTIGYLLAAFELAKDIKAGLLPLIDRIYVAAGSGSTLAGLALGTYLGGLPTEIVGVRVVSRTLVNDRIIHRLLRESTTLLEASGVNIGDWQNGVRYRILTGHLGRGYGYETMLGQAATMIATQDHLTLDPIYTAKAVGALIKESKQSSGTTLFWHTLNTIDLSPRLKVKALSSLPAAYHSLLGG